jgi:hypothetical protein
MRMSAAGGFRIGVAVRVVAEFSGHSGRRRPSGVLAGADDLWRPMPLSRVMHLGTVETCAGVLHQSCAAISTLARLAAPLNRLASIAD